jgi:lipid-A-disaccharide synthase
MNPKTFMVIAGEASGDLNAAELVYALRREFAAAPAIKTLDYQPLQTSLEPEFFGAGGPRMAAAGVELAFDLTEHSVTGFSEVLKHYFKFKRLFGRLVRLALDRQPDCIICVDFSGFNGRFVHAIKRHVRAHHDWFHGWNPRLVQYVSPQVWASRPGRAYRLENDLNLLLSIIPFEKNWYAKRTPGLRVEFVGNPIAERYSPVLPRMRAAEPQRLLLLPGSREGEISRHLPVMCETVSQIRSTLPGLTIVLVLSDEALVEQARTLGIPDWVKVRCGGLEDELSRADVAIASTGTVTLECAWFGVPTVAMYKTSFMTYQIARQIVTVKFVAMPNLLADEELFPEFIQEAASPRNIATATLNLLRDEELRTRVKRKLAGVVATLGGPGASERAAREICRLLRETQSEKSSPKIAL